MNTTHTHTHTHTYKTHFVVNIGEITDTRIKTYEELTHFLSSFIEHVSIDILLM